MASLVLCDRPDKAYEGKPNPSKLKTQHKRNLIHHSHSQKGQTMTILTDKDIEPTAVLINPNAKIKKEKGK